MNYQAVTILLIIALVFFLIIHELASFFRKKRICNDMIEPEDVIEKDETLEDVSVQEEKPPEKVWRHEPLGAMATDFDRDALISWYNNQATKHRRNLVSATRSLRLLFCIFLLAFLVILAPRTSVFHDIIVWIGFNGLIYSAPILIYFYLSKRKKISLILRGNRYVELNEKQFPKIWDASFSIMQKMHLPYPLRIYYVKHEKAEASIVFENGTIYLLLSRGMISWSHFRFKDVESIIGHEFGHICQGDTRLMLIRKNAVKIPAIICTVGFLSWCLGMILYSPNHLNPARIDGGFYFLVIFIYWLFIAQRRYAENLADMASLIFVENSTIFDLIGRHMPKTGNFSYPGRSLRLRFIRNVVNKFKKDTRYNVTVVKQSEVF